MKKFTFFLLVALILSSQSSFADTYQHWVTWYKSQDNILTKTDHSVSSQEMAAIVTALYKGEISPFNKYKLSTGVIYSIPQPDLYLEYVERCVRASRPGATTAQAVIAAINGSEMTRWGNDISVRVKNYYYSSMHKRIQYNDNYSGSEMGVDVLVIDGIPTIKCDCGNPLEGINPVYKKTNPVLLEEKKSFSEEKETSSVIELPKDEGSVKKETKPDLGVLNPYAEKAEDDKKKTWVGKNLIWLIPTAAVLVGALGFAAHDKGHKWYLWFPKTVAHQATMSGGRDYVETPASKGENSTDTGGGTGGRGN